MSTKVSRWAIHESGHAVVANAIGLRIAYMELRQSGSEVGSMEFKRDESWSPEVELATSLGGLLAERAIFGDSQGEVVDMQKAERLAKGLTSPGGDWRTTLAQVFTGGEKLIGMKTTDLKRLAQALDARRSLSGGEIREILDGRRQR